MKKNVAKSSYMTCSRPRKLEAATRGALYKKIFLEIPQYLQKNTCVGVFFYKAADLQACNLLKKTPTQVFSCEYCEISKNNYFEELLRTAASETS